MAWEARRAAAASVFLKHWSESWTHCRLSISRNTLELWGDKEERGRGRTGRNEGSGRAGSVRKAPVAPPHPFRVRLSTPGRTNSETRTLQMLDMGSHLGGFTSQPG